jgi:hypothetical protein
LPDFKPRIEERAKVMIRARLRGAGPERDACILDVSSRGLAVTADNPPQRGDFVELEIGEHKLVGQVKWSGMRRFGLVLRQRISAVALISGDSDAITLQESAAARKHENRKRNSRGNAAIKRRIEFAIFLVVGAVAIYVMVGYVGAALSSLESAKQAMSGKDVG